MSVGKWKHLYTTCYDELVTKRNEDDRQSHTDALQRVLSEQLDQTSIGEKVDMYRQYIRDAEDLENMIKSRHEETLETYSDYVTTRKMGGPRRMFADKHEAIWYLMQMAPTKLVDGIWLEGVSNMSPSSLRNHLMRIYMDERGCYEFDVEGVGSERDHIVVYRRLLKNVLRDACFEHVKCWTQHFLLMDDDALFLNGSVQMALGACTSDFLPEVVGYTLAYEGISLSLLIASYELKELGIDSSYFDIHITVDNIDCGHAAHSIEAARCMLEDASTTPAEKNESMERLLRGYVLCEHTSTESFGLCARYDCKSIVENILRRKAVVSHALHDTVIDVHGDNLGDIMRSKSSLLEYLVSRNFLAGDVFEGTRFYAVLKEKMMGTFAKDELEFVRSWFDESVLSKRRREHVRKNDRDRILEILLPVMRKHRNVMLQHPESGVSDSMSNWLRRGTHELWSCLASNEGKRRIKDSFTNGAMQNVQMDESERKFVLDWCRRN